MFTYPIGLGYQYIAFGAIIIGLIRKGGIPGLSANYVRTVVFTEDFTNFTYFLSIALVKRSLFTYTVVIINAVLLLAVEFKKTLDNNPTTPILSVGFM